MSQVFYWLPPTICLQSQQLSIYNVLFPAVQVHMVKVCKNLDSKTQKHPQRVGKKPMLDSSQPSGATAQCCAHA